MFVWLGWWVDVLWDDCIINPDCEISVERGKHVRFIKKCILIHNINKMKLNLTTFHYRKYLGFLEYNYFL